MPMYVPARFREDRPEILAGAIHSIQFAAIVTPGPEGLQITHAPTVLKENDGGGWSLELHVARDNPHWTLTGGDGESTAIFQGPHTYVSPSWYASKREHGRVVPTWNYIAVHAQGRLEAIDDESWLIAHLNDLTNANEAARETPWTLADAPGGFIHGLTRGIVGLKLTIKHLEGVWKMSQQRSEMDRLGVIQGLEGEQLQPAVAEIMRKLEAERQKK